MIDCPNGDIRDLLPDLVHERLDASARAQVKAHVAGCEACTAEVALLERIRATAGRYGAAPVSVERVVSALPRAGRTSQRWSRSVGLRIAAGLVVLVAGASWLQSVRGGVDVNNDPESVAVAAQVRAGQGDQAVRPAASESGRTVTAKPAVVATRQISLDDDLTDLSDRELQSLLGALDSFEAVTRVEPAALDPIIVSESG